ncbi:FMN-dependent NADH-azoreductase [Breoghania corrubedonensis]|uniref:FMN dependent NADH:quinone oxidoreductase n=1 Tax=Breoghania corrubedonensis TaxID=665038 RepID=A0A2T5V519_9HYPH|nr:NAD(P)H-dependent oxidoreductase [Breoghania corrubedonensis]PTW58849.1 FMN-dependent NADH-azoreductase [Breoghania corrubedonensis]
MSLTILKVDSSARSEGSTSRDLTNHLVDAFKAKHDDVTTISRDVAVGLPVVNQGWIAANFTDPAERTDEHKAALALSDTLIGELRAADAVVIGVPVYNFGVPAALKAWVDLVCRARETFRYTEAGPEGLLTGKKAYLVVSSAGVPVESEVDFATRYMRHMLAFVGITDVTVIAAGEQMFRVEEALEAARKQITVSVESFSRAA